MPPFYALAGVNAWQSSEGLVNRHCAKKKIKRRVNEDPQVKDLFKGRRRRAVFTGVYLKVLTAGLGLGLDDLGSVASIQVARPRSKPQVTALVWSCDPQRFMWIFQYRNQNYNSLLHFLLNTFTIFTSYHNMALLKDNVCN